MVVVVKNGENAQPKGRRCEDREVGRSCQICSVVDGRVGEGRREGLAHGGARESMGAYGTCGG